MRKLLLTFGFIALVLISPSYLYGCGGEGGGEGGVQSDPFSEFLGALMGFKPENQNYIPVSALKNPVRPTQEQIENMPIVKEMEKEQQKQAIQDEAYWQNEIAEREITKGNIADINKKAAKVVGIAAGISVGALAGPAGLTAAGAIGVGAGYSAVTTAAEDIADKKSAKEILKKATKAALQSAALGYALPDNPIVAGTIDAAIANVPNAKVATHMDGLVDYGPGHVDLANGVKVMK